MRSLTRLLLPAGVTMVVVLGLASTTGDAPRERRSLAASTASAEASAPGAVAAAGARTAPNSARPRRPHALLLVLDELPGDSLLDPSGRIDAGRYPNFAELAADSTWFPNAYSTYDSTTKAVPLILDGLRPVAGSEPDRRWHPRSIFTALGRSGYRVVAAEEATALCAPSLCRGGHARRPAIMPRLLRGRPERFARFVRSIRAGRRPTFWMKHVLLPHGPYVYLPSGARTRSGPQDLIPDMNSTLGFHDPYLTRHNEQRYLLQLGFVDRLLGRLLRRLKAAGIYDDTLIVVTADHGFAWQVGVATRRSVSPSNIHELTTGPLLVKRPGQRAAHRSEAYAQTLDVAPTIADVLGVRLGYRTHGHSVFSRTVRRRRGVAVTTRDFSAIVRISGRRWQARRGAVVRRRLRQLGWGDWQSLYTGIGPHRELLDRRVAGLARAAAGGLRASVAGASAFDRVRRPGGIVPAQVAGTLHGDGASGSGRPIAVAVNGRIEGVGYTFQLAGVAGEHYGVNVPEAALGNGANVVEIFEITRTGELRSLARA
jgi:Sulfatase